MKNIIRKILKEDRRQEYLNKIVQVMKNDFPIIYNLKDYGFYDQLSEEELYYVFSGVFGKPVVKYLYGGIYDENGNELYIEYSDGFWVKKEYNDNHNVIYFENHGGIWRKYEYDENGNEIYYENSDGQWVKREYDENGKQIYEEYSTGGWWKREYDENGKQIYYEDSDGIIKDNR